MIYKVCFQLVHPIGEGSQFYNEYGKPTESPGNVPDEFWGDVSRETSDPWQQYHTLKEWAANGEHLIRNVRLLKAEASEWVPVENPAEERLTQSTDVQD